MKELYKSQLGEIRSKKEWIKWAKDFYKNLGIDRPKDYWKRVVNVLKLKQVE